MKVGDFTASLYDLFGYLLPGLIATAALMLLATGTLDLSVLTNGVFLMAFLMGAYFIGHLVQAAGNRLFDKKLERAEVEVLNKLPVKVRERMSQLLRACFADPSGQADTDPFDFTKPEEAAAALAFIDESRVLGDKENERDLYIYREGFYRGTVIAFLLLGAMLLIRAWSGVSISWGSESNQSLELDYGRCVIAGLAVLIICMAYYARMLRFTGYRVKRSIYYWLALKEAKPAQQAESRVVCVCVPAGSQDQVSDAKPAPAKRGEGT
jgi:hypothetical protein